MALSVNLLTDVAQCDAVIAVIDERLRVVNKRETGADYQRDGATGAAAVVAARLAKLPGIIAGLTTDLAAETAGTAAHRKVDEELTEAQYELKELGFRQAERGPVYLVLREVDVDEAEDFRTSPEASRVAVVARRAVLAAA